MRGHRSLVLAAVLALTAAPWRSADASPSASLKLRGSQGDIQGSVTQKGREGSLRVLRVSHSVQSPRDPASGLATGKRQHKPVVVTVEFDRAAPLLYRALVTQEKLPEVLLRFYAPGQKAQAGLGLEVHSHSLRLVNASLAEIKLLKSDDPRASDTLELSFTYQRIEWIWVDGNITGADDWEVSKSKGL